MYRSVAGENKIRSKTTLTQDRECSRAYGTVEDYKKDAFYDELGYQGSRRRSRFQPPPSSTRLDSTVPKKSRGLQYQLNLDLANLKDIDHYWIADQKENERR
ncbi:hypothetical protein RB195_018461 [Necator americanus]|uniref:Uncharacterized protein n=1 Tax=Necator americanus TaxID=51031 RepID=A0ABR1CBC8_NECAM